MRIAYIMRGIPGSRKSTLAEVLAGEHGIIHSTDDYFYKNGEYIFDGTKLKDFHEQNFAAFCNSLKERRGVVICDNTNLKKADGARYMEAAKKSGYVAAYVVLPSLTLEEALKRNTHHLSRETIEKMIEEFEE